MSVEAMMAKRLRCRSLAPMAESAGRSFAASQNSGEMGSEQTFAALADTSQALNGRYADKAAVRNHLVNVRNGGPGSNKFVGC